MMKNQNTRNLFGIVIPLAIGLLVVTGLFFAQSPALAGLLKPTPTIEDPILRDWAGEIEYFDDELRRSDLDQEVEKGLQAGRNYAARQATERAAYLQTPEEMILAIMETEIARATLEPTPTIGKEENRLKLGLQDVSSTPLFREAEFSTAWVEPYEDDYAIIYTGRLKKDPEQGVLIFFDPKIVKLEVFFSPEKDGDLSITGVKNGKVEMDSKKGKKNYFDIKTKKFTDWNGNLIEAVTTPTPPAYPAP
jgi:hypothetical protein